MRIPPLPILALAAALAAGAGCVSPRPYLPSVEKLPFVYRIDVQQGNVVTQEMLAQLQPGMEKSKVRFIMGTPLIVDTFHTNRWDYLYSMQEGGTGTREQRRITLYFEDDKLARVEGNVTAATGPLEVQRERSSMVDVPGQYQPSLVDKLKGTVGLAEDAPEKVEKKAQEADERSLMDKLKGSVGLGEDGEKAATVEEDGPAAQADEGAAGTDTGTSGPDAAAGEGEAAGFSTYAPASPDAPADDGVTDVEPEAEVAETPAPAQDSGGSGAAPDDEAPAGDAGPAGAVVDVPADAPRKQKQGFFSRLFGGAGGEDQAAAQQERADDADQGSATDEAPTEMNDSSGDYRDPTEPSTGGF